MRDLTAYLCILAAAQQRLRHLDRMDTMDAWMAAQPIRERISYLCEFIRSITNHSTNHLTP